MAEKPSGQCEACGYIRYPNDMINFGCQTCAAWAVDQIHALRAEVEALKAANFNIAVCPAHATGQEPSGCVLCEVARLQAELEKYTQPLTKDQACDVASSYGLLGYSPTCAERFDAAIRAAREGAK